MLIGERRRLKKVIPNPNVGADGQPLPYVFDVPPVVVVSLPDGTVESPAVTVTPGTDSPTQELTFMLELPLAGPYRVQWTYLIGGERFSSQAAFFATWSDVAGAIRTELSRSNIEIPDSVMEASIYDAWTYLASIYTCVVDTLGGYHLLPVNDQTIADNALYQQALAEVITSPWFLQGRHGTVVTKLTVGPVEKTYKEGMSHEAVASTASNAAKRTMRGISCVRAAFEQAQGELNAGVGLVTINPAREQAKRNPDSLYGKIFWYND